MSHEIRTPMNSILGFTSLLLEEEEEEKKRNALRIINRSGKNLLNLINNILDFSKIEAGKIDLEEKPFNLVYSLKHVYNMFRLKAKKVKLRFRLKIDPRLNGAFLGDEFRIEQILINILSNAFKFTSEGEIRFICRYVDEKVVLSISDTGIGIPPDKQKQIFESFTQADTSTTRKYGGTGLGLSITLSLIRKMGGTIEVKSKPDRGSRFTIILPLEKTSDEWEEDTYEELMPVEVPSENNIEDPGVFTVLVADDNEMNRRLVGALLSGIGVTYETAENGQAVLNKLEECVLTNTPLYDLILLDMQMPVMDGIETIKRIRNDERFKEMYVIALTAFALKEEREECLRAGCDDYIAKPMDKDLFRRKINEQMQSGNL